MDPLRPEARGSLGSCHVTFGCHRCVTRSKKRGATFHGHAEKRWNNAQHPAAAAAAAALPQPGCCQRLRLQPSASRAPTPGTRLRAGEGASPQGRRAKVHGGGQQRDLPLDDGVQTLGSETRQERRRFVRLRDAVFLWVSEGFSLRPPLMEDISSCFSSSSSGSKGQTAADGAAVTHEAGCPDVVWGSISFLQQRASKQINNKRSF